VFPNMACETLPPGLLGIVFAHVAAAIMSTAQGTLLASSTRIAKDIIRYHFFQNINIKHCLKLPTMIALHVGSIAIIISLWVRELLVAIDVAYAILAGSIFIPIVFGLFWKRTTGRAAFYAITISALVVIGGLAVEGLASTNPILYGIAVNIIVIVVVSLLDKDNKSVASKET